MANPARNRKRVYAIPRRAPDGSAFQPCDKCGVSVAIALLDMHECKNSVSKRDFKRFRGCFSNRNLPIKQTLDTQPLSPFRYFMESFEKSCDSGNPVDVDKKGFETWKTMSKEERRPYVDHARRVNSAYYKRWSDEIRYHMFTLKVDDEADSLEFMKFDMGDCSDDYGGSECEGGGSSHNNWERYLELARMIPIMHG
ncbi:hypothetical protein LINGRAHAP2_LOCUS14772 [Linum grandiflorum]